MGSGAMVLAKVLPCFTLAKITKIYQHKSSYSKKKTKDVSDLCCFLARVLARVF